MTDERLKQLIEQVGMPNSRSLYQALQQAETEGAASRDAEVAELKRSMKFQATGNYDYQEELKEERDQLREQVALLRDALSIVSDQITNVEWEQINAALLATANLSGAILCHVEQGK
jgi:predicted transcriptional regulator